MPLAGLAAVALVACTVEYEIPRYDAAASDPDEGMTSKTDAMRVAQGGASGIGGSGGTVAGGLGGAMAGGFGGGPKPAGGTGGILVGGASSVGGSAGFGLPTGGSAAGGTPSATGGAPVPATGGMPAAGGSVTGGAPATGGDSGTGGTPATTRPTRFDFELDEQGWQDLKGQGSVVRRSAVQRHAGAASLEILIDNRGAGSDGNATQRYIGVPADKTPVLTPGQTLTFQVWIPSGSQLLGLQPFVVTMGGHWVGTWRLADVLQKNSWNALSVTLPAVFEVDRLEWVGVQFITHAGGWQGAVYVDTVMF